MCTTMHVEWQLALCSILRTAALFLHACCSAARIMRGTGLFDDAGIGWFVRRRQQLFQVAPLYCWAFSCCTYTGTVLG